MPQYEPVIGKRDVPVFPPLTAAASQCRRGFGVTCLLFERRKSSLDHRDTVGIAQVEIRRRLGGHYLLKKLPVLFNCVRKPPAVRVIVGERAQGEASLFP